MTGMNDMTQGAVKRHLLHMASFMAVSMVVQTLYLLADLYWVGTLGKEAIAAVGLSGNLMMLVMALTQTLSVGTTTVISHAAGRKDQPHAELSFNQSTVLAFAVAVFFSRPIQRGLERRRAHRKTGRLLSRLVHPGVDAPVSARVVRLSSSRDR